MSTRRMHLFTTTFPTVSLTATFSGQFDRPTVYEAVTTICKACAYGFKIRKDENNKLSVLVYEGVDRSYSQSTNPYVIFSPDFDNVISSSFYLSEKGKINVVVIITKDTFDFPTSLTYHGDGSAPTDMNRFEAVLETDVDKDLDPENPLSIDDRMGILVTRGLAVLNENKTVGFFEGDFYIQGNFKYGIDFFMGDMVQCFIEGRNTTARIIELVQSYSTEGEKSYVAMDFIAT